VPFLSRKVRAFGRGWRESCVTGGVGILGVRGFASQRAGGCGHGCARGRLFTKKKDLLNNQQTLDFLVRPA